MNGQGTANGKRPPKGRPARAARARLACLAAVLAVSARAQAAVEFGGSLQDGAGRASALTFEATVGPGTGRYLLVVVTTSGPAATVRLVRWGTTALVLIGGSSAPGGGCRVEWWGLMNPPSGTLPVHLELEATANNAGATLLWYKGVDLAAPVRWVSASGTQGPTEVAVTGVPGGVVLDGACAFSPESVLDLAGPAQIGRWHWSIGSLSSAGSEARREGPVSLTWTASRPGPFDWTAGGLTLFPAGVSTAPVDVPLKVETAGCAVLPRPGSSRSGLGLLGAALVLVLVQRLGRRACSRRGGKGAAAEHSAALAVKHPSNAAKVVRRTHCRAPTCRGLR